MRALDEIESSIAWAENQQWDSPKHSLGAAEFWHPDQRIHTLSAVYYVWPDSKGLAVSAGTEESYTLPGYHPAELAKLLGKAIDAFLARTA
ncbi:MAG TPA: hypothetical protein VK669_15165 [Candidatus Limnocylindrales bacterium]|nr:hypothetical protein [Candidatus Limnocylindrales bacterium]